MATQDEIKAVFPQMLERFNAEKAAGVNTIIQFNLTGDNGGSYWVKIADGAVETGEGENADSGMTFTSSADDFFALVNGNLNPMQAFMMGKIKVSDVGMGMKMINIFGLS
jgi:putative sterol carrier protein